MQQDTMVEFSDTDKKREEKLKRGPNKWKFLAALVLTLVTFILSFLLAIGWITTAVFTVLFICWLTVTVLVIVVLHLVER